MSDPSITIGLNTYNGIGRAQVAFYSVQRFTDPRLLQNCKLVLVDDGSDPKLIPAFEETAKNHNAKLIRSDSNKGISWGWNQTANAFPETDLIIWLNDDIVLVKDWLSALVHFHGRNKCGTVGLGTYFFNTTDYLELIQDPMGFDKVVDPISREYIDKDEHSGNDKPGRVMAATGCCFSMKRDLFKKIGGFDETMKSFYEETLMGVECAKRGFSGFQLPYPYIYHAWSQTFATSPELKAGERLEASRKYFIEKTGGDINDSPTNPHRVYMKEIGPQTLKWMKKDGYGEFEETWKNVYDDASTPEDQRINLKEEIKK